MTQYRNDTALWEQRTEIMEEMKLLPPDQFNTFYSFLMTEAKLRRELSTELRTELPTLRIKMMKKTSSPRYGVSLGQTVEFDSGRWVGKVRGEVTNIGRRWCSVKATWSEKGNQKGGTTWRVRMGSIRKIL